MPLPFLRPNRFHAGSAQINSRAGFSFSNLGGGTTAVSGASQWTSSFMTSFDGLGNHIDLAKPNVMNNANQVVWSWWMNATGINNNSTIMSRLPTAGPAQMRFIFNNNNIRIFINSGSTIRQKDTTFSFVTGTNYHCLFVFDGQQPENNDKLYGFINGVSATFGAPSGQFPNLITSGNFDWFIGQNNNAVGHFTGSIDELAVWTGITASQSDASSVYNGGHPGDLVTSSMGLPTVWLRMGDLPDSFPNLTSVGSVACTGTCTANITAFSASVF